MKKLDDAMAAHVAGMEKKFGKPIQEWIDLVVSWNEPKHMANVKRLKEEFGIGHGHAQMVVFLAKENSSAHLDDGDMAQQMLKGKEVWQPLHEKLKALVREVSEEIEFSQKKTYLSLRTSKQIATMGPSPKEIWS